MKSETKLFLSQFIQLMSATFILLLLSVSLGKQTIELLVYMNDSNLSKTWGEWAVFWIGGIVCLAIWNLIWIWFKKSEKISTDLFIQLIKPEKK